MHIEYILRKCHISSRYKGYYILIDAIYLYINNSNYYISLQNDIYKQLAAKYNTSIYSIESNIRRIIEKCWQNDKLFMNQIFGYKLNRCPSNGEFIDFVAYYVKEKMS